MMATKAQKAAAAADQAQAAAAKAQTSDTLDVRTGRVVRAIADVAGSDALDVRVQSDEDMARKDPEGQRADSELDGPASAEAQLKVGEDLTSKDEAHERYLKNVAGQQAEDPISRAYPDDTEGAEVDYAISCEEVTHFLNELTPEELDMLTTELDKRRSESDVVARGHYEGADLRDIAGL